MEHPTLTPNEKRIVSEASGRLNAQLLQDGIAPERWANIVLALVIDLSGQVLRLVGKLEEEEKTDPSVPCPCGSGLSVYVCQTVELPK